MVVSVDGRDLLWVYQDRGRVVFQRQPGYAPVAVFAVGGGDADFGISLTATGEPAFTWSRRP
jgi:hypothetical protein